MKTRYYKRYESTVVVDLLTRHGMVNYYIRMQLKVTNIVNCNSNVASRQSVYNNAALAVRQVLLEMYFMVTYFKYLPTCCISF